MDYAKRLEKLENGQVIDLAVLYANVFDKVKDLEQKISNVEVT